MVFYFKTRCGEYTIYMGKDKYENEDLIKYGLDLDVWFHVDDLSSAHVYLRMKPNMVLEDIPEDVLLDCASLVKANSIAGCKMNNVYVVYTRWKNLKKTSDMVDGQVGYHRPQNVKRMNVEKNNPIVKQIEKTREERHPDLAQEQMDYEREVQRQKKNEFKRLAKEKEMEKLEMQREKELRSYDRLMNEHNMTSVSQMKSSVDETAAEEFEDDFF